MTEEAADFLRQVVESGYNLFISGGTNSGKTTFLNALSAYIPKRERVITIEDSAELQIRQIPNLVRLETRNANTEGEGEVTMSQLIRAALRMNPSRIIVGEVRGREALDMLQAMNTGHDGSLSTGHGNSPKDMLSRLETMVLMGAELPLAAIRSQIASALDLIIHLGRLRDGSRKVLQISEIGGNDNGNVEIWNLFRYDAAEGALKRTGELKNRENFVQQDIARKKIKRRQEGPGAYPAQPRPPGEVGKAGKIRTAGKTGSVGDMRTAGKVGSAGKTGTGMDYGVYTLTLREWFSTQSRGWRAALWPPTYSTAAAPHFW